MLTAELGEHKLHEEDEEPLVERGDGEALCGDEGALCSEEMLLCSEGVLLLCSEGVLCGEGVLCDLAGSWEVPRDEHGGESRFSPVLSSRGGRVALLGRECVLVTVLLGKKQDTPGGEMGVWVACGRPMGVCGRAPSWRAALWGGEGPARARTLRGGDASCAGTALCAGNVLCAGDAPWAGDALWAVKGVAWALG